MLFVDLDDFKVVNDTMGHGVGDELLVAVAARLAASVRQSDTAARLGGDEFALLIDDAADPEAVDAFAERIVAAFTEPFTLSEAKVLATATVGVATSRGQRRRGRAAAARGPGPVRGEGGGQAALAALPAGADQRDAAGGGRSRPRSRTP